MFKTFKTAVSDEAQQEAGLITEHMRNRYFTMWRHQLQQEAKERDLESEAKDRHDNEMQKRIFGSMRLAMQRSKSLKNSEEKVKEMRDTRVLKEVMSTLNNMKEVKQMRERALVSLFEKMHYRVLAQTLYKIRSHAYKRTLNAQADHHYQSRL